MKKFFSIILALALVFSLAVFTTPAAFADDGSFAVTKHPTAETVAAGSKVLFVSYPNVAQYTQYWVFEDGAGQRIDAENLPNYYPGVKVELEGTKIRILNVAEEMTGLAVQAVFVRNGVEICSNYATLTVTPGKRCADTTVNGDSCSDSTATAVCTVRITKQPVDETKLNCQRSSTYFEVRGENIARVEWVCKIGESGEVMTIPEAIERYGIQAEGYDTTILTLRSGDWSQLEGWMWMARLYDCNSNCATSKWVWTLTGWCSPVPECQPCAPCTSCAPCTPCEPVIATPCEPICSYPATGCGFGVTEFTSTTTSHYETETNTTITSHGYTFW